MFIECIYQFIVSGVLEEIKKAVHANMTSVALLVAHIFYMAYYDSVELKNKLTRPLLDYFQLSYIVLFYNLIYNLP